MRDSKKKIRLAEKHNSRVTLCNAHETAMLLELAINTDKIYKHIRANSGVKIPFEQAQKYSTDFQFIASSLESFLANIAKELNLPNVRQSSVLQQYLQTKANNNQ